MNFAFDASNAKSQLHYGKFWVSHFVWLGVKTLTLAQSFLEIVFRCTTDFSKLAIFPVFFASKFSFCPFLNGTLLFFEKFKGRYCSQYIFIQLGLLRFPKRLVFIPQFKKSQKSQNVIIMTIYPWSRWVNKSLNLTDPLFLFNPLTHICPVPLFGVIDDLIGVRHFLSRNKTTRDSNSALIILLIRKSTSVAFQNIFGLDNLTDGSFTTNLKVTINYSLSTATFKWKMKSILWISLVMHILLLEFHWI